MAAAAVLGQRRSRDCSAMIKLKLDTETLEVDAATWKRAAERADHAGLLNLADVPEQYEQARQLLRFEDGRKGDILAALLAAETFNVSCRALCLHALVSHAAEQLCSGDLSAAQLTWRQQKFIAENCGPALQRRLAQLRRLPWELLGAAGEAAWTCAKHGPFTLKEMKIPPVTITPLALQDGRLALYGGYGKPLLIDMEKEAGAALLPQPAVCSCMVQLRDGRIAYSRSCRVTVWNPDTDASVMTQSLNAELRAQLLPLTNGQLATSDRDGIKLWSAGSDSMQLLRTLPDSTTSSHMVQLSTGKLAAISNTVVKVWDVATGCKVATLWCDAKPSTLLKLTTGALAVGCSNGKVVTFGVGTGACPQELQGLAGYVERLVELADGRLAAACRGGHVYIMNLQSGCCDAVLGTAANPLEPGCIAQLADGSLITGITGDMLEIWNVNTGECQDREPVFCPWPEFVLPLENGRVACVGDGTLYL